MSRDLVRRVAATVRCRLTLHPRLALRWAGALAFAATSRCRLTPHPRPALRWAGALAFAATRCCRLTPRPRPALRWVGALAFVATLGVQVEPVAPSMGEVSRPARVSLGLGQAWAQDEVDAALAAGNQAMRAKQYTQAVQHYERARSLMPGRSSTLSYNLGTAYAHLGKLGIATAHLHQALQDPQDQTLADATRQNLGLLRRQAETQAAASGRVLTDPPGWSSVVFDVFATPMLAWASIALVWLAALLAILGHRRSAPAQLRRALWIFALSVPVVVMVLVARHQARDGAWVVVGDKLQLHDGPGAHRPVLMELQPSSRVSVLKRSSGWAQVRLPGARQGWIQTRALAPLQGWSAPILIGPQTTAKSKKTPG